MVKSKGLPAYEHFVRVVAIIGHHGLVDAEAFVKHSKLEETARKAAIQASADRLRGAATNKTKNYVEVQAPVYVEFCYCEMPMFQKRNVCKKTQCQ